MDIGKLVAQERIYEVKHPVKGDELGIRLTLVSMEAEEMRKLRREIANRASKLQLRGKIITAEEGEKNWIKLLFTGCTGWEWYGDVNFNGAKPAFSEANFIAVCEKLPWFRDQIDEQIGEFTNFIPA